MEITEDLKLFLEKMNLDEEESLNNYLTVSSKLNDYIINSIIELKNHKKDILNLRKVYGEQQLKDIIQYKNKNKEKKFISDTETQNYNHYYDLILKECFNFENNEAEKELGFKYNYDNKTYDLNLEYSTLKNEPKSILIKFSKETDIISIQDNENKEISVVDIRELISQIEDYISINFNNCKFKRDFVKKLRDYENILIK